MWDLQKVKEALCGSGLIGQVHFSEAGNNRIPGALGVENHY